MFHVCSTELRTHRCRNKRDSAAQSRLRSSALGLLCLLCAGICKNRDGAVSENRRTMSQLLKHSGIARAQRDRGRVKDEKYSG